MRGGSLSVGVAVGAFLGGCGGGSGEVAAGGGGALRAVGANELRVPADFAGIADRGERSRALFAEMSRVLMHPRCLNCHPDGDVPRQGIAMVLHDPPAVRGADNHGVVGMRCDGCHQDRNVPLARVPGAPKWGLAPIEMAWVNRSARQICEQIKDPARNDHKSLAQITEHMGHDELVAWGWAPGADREPVPGTQKQLGELAEAWVATGAECPVEEAKR